MNVTLKLPDELVREARHCAINHSQSLSAWMADLVRRELNAHAGEAKPPMAWIDAFSGDSEDEFLSRDIPIADRKTSGNRKFTFDPEDA